MVVLEQAIEDIEARRRWTSTVVGLRRFLTERRIRPMPLAFRLGTAWGLALGPVFLLRRSRTVGQADAVMRRMHTAAVMFHEYQHIRQYFGGRNMLREGTLAYVLGSRAAHRALEYEPYLEELRFVEQWLHDEPSGPLREALAALGARLDARVRSLSPSAL